MLQSPLSAYRFKIQSKEILPDSSQALAVEKLQILHLALKDFESEGGFKGWRERFILGARRESSPKGVYIFGGVGRGKSMLMDLFLTLLPLRKKAEFIFMLLCRIYTTA